MNARQRLGRLLSTVLVVVLSWGVACGMAGCAKQDEEQIRSAITKSMDMLKNPSEDDLSAYLEESDVDLSNLESYGIDFYEFLGHCFGKLDYTIDGITIDGKEATADLTLTNADLSAAAGRAAATITDNLADYTDILQGENAEQELMRTFIGLFYDEVDGSDDTITTEGKLTFKKRDGVWEVDRDSVVALMEGMYRDITI